MFADYQEQILLTYKKKRDANNLPLQLSQPTPNNLRSACADICRQRFNRKDEGVLSAFFGYQQSQEDYINTIGGFEIDRFRPVLNFMRESTSKTDFKNVELLAWLIDFQPRPYNDRYKYEDEPAVEKETTTKGNAPDAGIKVSPTGPGTGNNPNDSISIPGENSGTGTWRKLPFIKRGVIVAAISLAGYSLVNSIGSKTGAEQCMYWAGDHYQPISCSQKIDGQILIAQDTTLVRHFSKITREDTITYNSIGSVWYSKINNELEYFTSDGEHPVKTGHRLKPITKYIIDKYIYARKIAP